MKEYCELVVFDHNRVGFVDGTSHIQTEWPHRWDKKTITYCIINGTTDARIFSRLRKAAGLAFGTWAAEIPTKFKRVSKNENPDIVIKFVNRKGQNKTIDEKPKSLGFAYYPGTSRQGLILINDYRYHWGLRDGRTFSNEKVYNIVHTLIHEIGHTLGLSHAEIKNGIDVMDPKYNGKTELSPYDVLRIRKKYGTRMFSRWSLYRRLKDFLRHRKESAWSDCQAYLFYTKKPNHEKP